MDIDDRPKGVRGELGSILIDCTLLLGVTGSVFGAETGSILREYTLRLGLLIGDLTM